MVTVLDSQLITVIILSDGTEFCCRSRGHTQAVMGFVYLRHGKMTYFRLRYRLRIITVFVLRMQIRREVLLKVLAFFRLRSVSVLIKPYRSIRILL